MRRMWVGVAVVAVLGVAGCANPAEVIAEKVVEQQAGDGVDVDLDEDGEGGFSVENEDGTYAYGSKAEVPAGFPSEVPLPDAALTIAMKEADRFTLSYDGASRADAEAYIAEFSGYEETSSMEAEGVIQRTFVSADWEVMIWFSPVDSQDVGAIMLSVGAPAGS